MFPCRIKKKTQWPVCCLIWLWVVILVYHMLEIGGHSRTSAESIIRSMAKVQLCFSSLYYYFFYSFEKLFSGDRCWECCLYGILKLCSFPQLMVWSYCYSLLLVFLLSFYLFCICWLVIMKDPSSVHCLSIYQHPKMNRVSSFLQIFLTLVFLHTNLLRITQCMLEIVLINRIWASITVSEPAVWKIVQFKAQFSLNTSV